VVARSLALLLPLLTACGSTGPASEPDAHPVPEPSNPWLVQRDWGVATAGSEAQARQLADCVEEVLAVYRELPGYEERPIRIHLVPELGQDFDGLTITTTRRTSGLPLELLDGYILVRSRDGAFSHGTVGHELAHHGFYRAHAPLPSVVDEGLCHLLSYRAVADEADRRDAVFAAVLGYAPRYRLAFQVDRRGGLNDLLDLVGEWRGLGAPDLPTLEEALAFDHDDWLALDGLERDALSGLAWVLVDRTGHGALLEAAARDGAVSPEVFLELAGVDPEDPASLERAFLEFLGGSGGDDAWVRLQLETTAKDG
jgi:hypothetical protein